jgi:methionyl-tRNA formyltransferase
MGRNQKQVKVPEPKKFGVENNVPVFQEQNLKDPEIIQKIKEMKPDLMVVISYGRLIPREIFEIPPYGTVNIHASILPQYRGASPIQQSLLNGDEKTGITIQKINEKMDEGNLLVVRELRIEKQDTYPELRRKLAILAEEVLKDFIRDTERGDMPEEKPQLGIPSYCTKIKKENGRVRWESESGEQIYNKWRAFYPWPGIYGFYKGKMVKLKEIQPESISGPPGTVIQADKNGFIVAAKQGGIRIEKLQPANKKEMSYQDFLNGYQIKAGDTLE